ncbi:DUF2787 domain-containing protein [Photobacterium sp. DNB23_23_1]
MDEPITKNSLYFKSNQFPISEKLYISIETAVNQTTPKELPNALTINFRDTTYSAENGGFHPVEIMICRDSDNLWEISYIIDFAYSGGPYPELGIELDFNFKHNTFQQMSLATTLLNTRDVIEFYQIWENNFLSYIAIGAFDQVKVSM